jgi:hypothetical protein
MVVYRKKQEQAQNKKDLDDWIWKLAEFSNTTLAELPHTDEREHCRIVGWL